MGETCHSSAIGQQREKEEVGGICFADTIFPGLDPGPVASLQGMLGSVVHFVAKSGSWPSLGSTQPCLYNTIFLGYWGDKKRRVLGSQQVQRKVVSEGLGPMPPTLRRLCHCIPTQGQGS